jgi:protocatechuate 3,4-dioxygenase beta subunit
LLICALVGFSVPEAASQQIFTGSVSGRVLDADTGAPLAGIVVEAGSTDIEAVTDSRGRYTLGGLRPGQVSISARGGNNRIFSLTAPRPVRVLAGAESSGIDLPVRLTAAISGRVFDPDGNPIPGIEVSALRAEYSILGVYGAGREYANGAAWLHRDGQATTDDRGRYVIDGLSAGRTYRILAHPQRQSAPVSDAPADPERRNRVLAPGYYPNAPSMSQALPVVLGSLETRDNVDIRMSDGPSFCVQAALDGDPMPVVSGEPGARARPVRFFVAREDIAAYENLRSLGVSGEFGPEGLLRICGLSPGTYVLAALGPQEGRMPSTYSSMTFVVSDRDVGGIRITANPLLSISGEAVWESTPPDVEQPPELTVRVARQAGTVWDASATSVPGTFSLRVPSGVH